MAAPASGIFWALTILLIILKHQPQESMLKCNEKLDYDTKNHKFNTEWVFITSERKILGRNDYLLADLVLSLTYPSKTTNQKMTTKLTTGKYDHPKLAISTQLLLLILLRCGDVHPCPGPSVNTSNDSIPLQVHRTISAEQHDHNAVSPFQCLRRKGLHFLHLNARSVISKLVDLKRISQEARPAVLAVSESWLDSSVTDDEVKIDGYTILRKDRNRNGGGVCMYVKNSIAFNRRSDFTSTLLESIWIDLLIPKMKPITIGTCYRPPRLPINDSLEELQSIVSNINMDNETYILGDFNINYDDVNSPGCKKYHDILLLYNFYQIIDNPTRVTTTTSTTLDHILCNVKENVCQKGTLDLGISDHMVIYCTRKVVKGIVNVNNIVKVRSMKNYDQETFVDMLGNVNWKCVLDVCDVNLAWYKFKGIIDQIINQIAPEKTVRVKSKTELWMTGEIIEMINSRDKLFSRYKKNREDEELYKLYCQKRNLVQRTVKIAKAEYFSHQIKVNKSNPKKLWSHLKNLGYSNKTTDKTNIVLNINNELCHDSKKVADFINSFFTNVASKLVSELPRVDELYGIGSSMFRKFYQKKGVTPSSFRLKEISLDFVRKELKELNENKSTGLDGISPRFLKDGADILCKPIAHIVNLSLSNCIVPTAFKEARITPLYKKNSKLEVGNYRPVSVLSTVSKILERAVYNQLEDYLQNSKLLYKFQSGFRKYFSTSTCLTYLTDYIKYEIAAGKYVGMVALDVQKAFDCVNHRILCQKLEFMGVESSWFNSYLTGRTQIVVANGVQSETESIQCGVPQGSLLGPLLYLCYCNDMELATKCDLVLYADDSIILYSDKDHKVIEKKLSDELKAVNQWLIENKLSLHPGKCESILFASKRKINQIPSFSIKFNNIDIVGKSSLKYLGSIIENDLSGKESVDNIIKKANGRLKFLYRHKNVLSRETRKILSMALVQSHIDYACMSWYFNLTDVLQSKLQVLQNKMIRFILGLGNREHVGRREFSRINCTNIENRVKQLGLNIVHKIFYIKKPEYLLCNFVRASDVHGYSTRNSVFNFKIPTSCNAIVRNSFSFNIIKSWNALSDNIKCIEDHQQFKYRCKRHLLTKCRY